MWLSVACDKVWNASYDETTTDAWDRHRPRVDAICTTEHISRNHHTEALTVTSEFSGSFTGRVVCVYLRVRVWRWRVCVRGAVGGAYAGSPRHVSQCTRGHKATQCKVATPYLDQGLVLVVSVSDEGWGNTEDVVFSNSYGHEGCTEVLLDRVHPASDTLHTQGMSRHSHRGTQLGEIACQLHEYVLALNASTTNYTAVAQRCELHGHSTGNPYCDPSPSPAPNAVSNIHHIAKNAGIRTGLTSAGNARGLRSSSRVPVPRAPPKCNSHSKVPHRQPIEHARAAERVALWQT